MNHDLKPSTDRSALVRSINGGEADRKGRPPSRIGVFCGSRAGARPEYLRTAEEIGQAIAERGGSLIYGAGGVGLMGAVSDAAHQAGAKVIGVIPASLHERERLDNACGEIIVVENMHARKALMYELADAFVILPGGYGTMDELMEVATWNQLGFHHRPLVLANINGFFDSLLTFLDRMATDGFMRPKERGLIRAATDPHVCLDVLGMARPIGATSLILLRTAGPKVTTRRVSNMAAVIPLEIKFGSGTMREGPLTWGQLAIWDVLRWLPEHDTSLTLTAVRPVPEGVTTAQAVAALGALVARHEALRTFFFAEGDGTPRQRVSPEGRIVIPVYDEPSDVQKILHHLQGIPFDLTTDLPIRAAIAHQDGCLVIVLAVSHMSVDAWSFRILEEDLDNLLAGVDLPDRGQQPLDRLDYEISDIGRLREERALAYWAEHIRETPASMIESFPQPSAPHLRWAKIESQALADAIRVISERTGATRSVVVLAATAHLLARYTGEDQAALRMIVATRFTPKTRRFVGALNQNALIRLPIGTESFDALVRRTAKVTLTAYQHCECNPRAQEQLIADIAAERGLVSDGYCFFNDISSDGQGRPASSPDPAPDPAKLRDRLRELRATTVLSIPEMDQVPKGATFFLFLEKLRDWAVLELCADSRFLSPRTSTDFLRDLEELIVTAAAPNPLFGSAAD